MKTIADIDLKQLKELPNNFNDNLTKKLDGISGDFDQNIVNEIVLWKVSRYAETNSNILSALNLIDPTSKLLDLELTTTILELLVNTKGIQLPMASTILRFRNPNIYQIIDQRVYRVIYGKELKLSTLIKKNINLYVEFLNDLKIICNKYGLKFENADRELYELDKIINKEIPLKNY